MSSTGDFFKTVLAGVAVQALTQLYLDALARRDYENRLTSEGANNVENVHSSAGRQPIQNSHENIPRYEPLGRYRYY